MITMIILEIEEPTGQRRIVHIAAEKALLGRAHECDVELDHETVSKKHAEIVKEGRGYVLRDLESYNGTYLNGRWITETHLRFKDRIAIGRFTLKFLSKGYVGPKRRKG